MPSVQVTLDNPDLAATAAAEGPKSEHQKEVTDLIRLVATDAVAPGYEVRAVRRSVRFPTGIEGMVVTEYLGPSFVGSKILLRNPGTAPSDLSEQDFASIGNVLGVWLETTKVTSETPGVAYVVFGRSGL